MNKKKTLANLPGCKLFIFFILILITQVSRAQTAYIRHYRPLSDSLSAAYGIPTSIILGIAIIESGSCSSQNCKLLNNHFGIVGRNNIFHKKRKSRYKQYPNSTASYIDFCRLMTRKKFYKTLKGNLNYALWADAISKSGYSEVPSVWKQRLLTTIKKYRL